MPGHTTADWPNSFACTIEDGECQGLNNDMKTYYVYQLVDPRNNKPFYIGKGNGNRAYQHSKLKDGNKNPYKDRKIKSILKENLEIRKRVEKSTGLLGGLAKAATKIPGIGQYLNAPEAIEEMEKLGRVINLEYHKFKK